MREKVCGKNGKKIIIKVRFALPLILLGISDHFFFSEAEEIILKGFDEICTYRK